MKIGINLLYLIPGIVGGTETYAAGLLSGLASVDQEDEFVVFVNEESRNWPIPGAANFARVVCPVRATSRMNRYFFEQYRLPKLLKHHSIGLVHSLGYIAPFSPGCLSVLTVPDLNYRAFGKEMPVARRSALRFFVGRSVQSADRLVTLSEFSRREIGREFNLPERGIAVTYLAPRQSDSVDMKQQQIHTLCNDLRVEAPYIIAFSSTSPNKNIPRLIEAFMQARRQHGIPHQLVLVGHMPASNGLTQMAASDNVRCTGFLEDQALQVLLRGSDMLVFPSYYEGFGLPVLEAMALGVPVVCSDKASLPEVAGDAALFFDPFSIDDMTRKIVMVALDSSLQETLRQKGERNLKRFSWDKAARETLEIYRDLHP